MSRVKRNKRLLAQELIQQVLVTSKKPLSTQEVVDVLGDYSVFVVRKALNELAEIGLINREELKHIQGGKKYLYSSNANLVITAKTTHTWIGFFHSELQCWNCHNEFKGSALLSTEGLQSSKGGLLNPIVKIISCPFCASHLHQDLLTQMKVNWGIPS
ncbi:MAG: hypothetical protein NVS2B14_00020 [Chamaesiphon sp.]